METSITEELLATVLKENIDNFKICGENICWNKTDILSANVANGCGNFEGCIHIQVFSHKCKEWLVHEAHQCVWSGNGWNKLDGYECTIASFYGGEEITFGAKTEAEAIFKATKEFIREEKTQ